MQKRRAKTKSTNGRGTGFNRNDWATWLLIIGGASVAVYLLGAAWFAVS